MLERPKNKKNADLGSAFETFVDSLPRVKNGSNIYDVYHIYITQTKKNVKGFHLSLK